MDYFTQITVGRSKMYGAQVAPSHSRDGAVIGRARAEVGAVKGYRTVAGTVPARASQGIRQEGY